jgi:hypothetical protein
MQTLTAPSPAASVRPCRAGRLRRFADDLGLAVVICSWIAVLITLVEGNPQYLYKQLVYSVSIGLIALLIIDGGRLLLFPHPFASRRWVLPYALLLVATAPVAHYGGILAAGEIVGDGWTPLADYPNPRQFNMILFTLCAEAGFSLLILSRERVERIKLERGEARERADTIERQALQAQLRLMQAQIEPHMLFNTLANLQGLIAIDPERASLMLDHLIAFLRATLSVSRAETTGLAQEFAAIEAYLGLMGVRMGERLRHRCLLPDALRAARLPTMLLQPLVENAIIHGLEPHIDGGEIVVEAVREGGCLVVTVSDTGLGLDGAGQHGRSAKGGGVGLATTRERLQALYGAGANLDLVPGHPRGAMARLSLPLEFT